MALIEFAGYVEPLFLQINARGGPIPWSDSNLPPFEFSYRIDKADVRIACEIDVVDDFAVNYVHLVVYFYVSSVINCLAFASAHGFTLILESCKTPSNDPAPLRRHNPALLDVCSFTSQEILDMAMRERKMLKPLNDLTDTLRNPMDSYVNVQRAIEGIAKLISSDNERAKRWEALRDNLQIGRPYLQFISDLSTQPRHGGTARAEMVVVAQVQLRGWTIMNRFLSYWKRGKTALPISEFPLL